MVAIAIDFKKRLDKKRNNDRDNKRTKDSQLDN